MHLSYTKNFKRQYKKLPQKTQHQFARRLHLFTKNHKNPLLKTHKLSGRYKNLYSFRVTGDIRVIYDADHDNTIIFVAIGSHSELYS